MKRYRQGPLPSARRWLALGVGLALVGPAVAMRVAAPHQKEIDRAQALLHFIVQERFADFEAACDDRMKAALPAEQLAEVWAQMTTQLGAYESVRSARAVAAGGYVRVEIDTRFAQSDAVVQVVLDDQQRVAGFFIRPTAARTPVAYVSPSYVDEAKFREVDVTIDAGAGFPLSGTLTLPKTEGPVPAVVLVHGSGPHDRDQTINVRKPFRDIAWGLASRGVAVLRYEKRTHRYQTSLDPDTITIETEIIDDALAGARVLMARDEVRSDAVYVAGHSLGGSAAPLIAAREPRLAGAVVLAGAARNVAEIIPAQLEYLGRIDGEYSSEERARVRESEQAVRKIRRGTFADTDQLLGTSLRYWADLNRLDTLKQARGLQRPILIVHGERDYQVSMAEYRRFERALGTRDNVTLKLFPTLDHLLSEGTGKSKPADYAEPGYVSEEVISALHAWIVANS